MPTLIVDDFQGGLDTRKSVFTAPPGSLRRAKNVHLTRGGELEIRKKFVPVYSVPGTKGLHSVRDQLYVFGSIASPGVPVGVEYQRLQAPSLAALTRVLCAESFDGKIYVAAEFEDGGVHHFYDGVRVTAWDTISGAVSDNTGVAAALSAKIDALSAFTASATGASFTVSAAPGAGFTYTASAANGGQVDDQTLTSELIQANVPAVVEVSASARVRIASGSFSAGVNTISAITVAGVNLIGAAVDWNLNNESTAVALAAAINAYASVPKYSATVEDTTVVIHAEALSGADANGRALSVTTTGNVVAFWPSTLTGGATAVSAKAQVVTFTVGGTYEADDQFTVTLDGVNFVVRGAASGTGTFVRALAGKMYAVTQSLLYFSGYAGDPPLPDPTQWDTSTAGAGFINMSTQDGGSDTLTGLATYQNRLAVFSRRNVQVWTMDADPANNSQQQVLSNVGTVAPRSIAAFGEVDVFFLSESGVRSLRARDSSNIASADDVGTAIDSDVLEWVRTQEEDTVRHAVATVEPSDGRYLLVIGGRIYVFSHFPGSKISAWSTYELEELGDARVVTDFAVTRNRLVARVGDDLCFYGGLSGGEYATDEEFTYEVDLPFLDARQPSAQKTLTGIDVGCEGFWRVFLASDPMQPAVTELLGVLDGPTYGQVGRVPAVGVSTHFALKFTGSAQGYARLANLTLHYTQHENG